MTYFQRQMLKWIMCSAASGLGGAVIAILVFTYLL